MKMGTGKSSEYFPHDCNAKDDPKIMLMMAQLGLEAYGIYWILVEYLRDQRGYRAPMVLLDPLSRRYGSSREKFEAIVTKFDLFEFNDQYFSSPSLVRRMEPMEKKREQQRQNISKRWHKNTNVLPPYNDGITDVIQSKVKESRVKKSKVKESKEEKSINNTPLDTLNQNDLLVQKWNDWCDFRKLLKKPYKTTQGAAAAYNKLCTLANYDSETGIAIINQSMENEWLGFFPLKTTTLRSKSTIPGEDPVDRIIREQKEYFKQHPITDTDGIKK
jgi:hypothetical protein